MEKLATAWPPNVKRVSGSRPSRPTRMTLLTDILLSPYVEQDNMKAKKNEMPGPSGNWTWGAPALLYSQFSCPGKRRDRRPMNVFLGWPRGGDSSAEKEERTS